MIELNKKTQQDFLNREWVQKLLDAGIDMSDAKYVIGKWKTMKAEGDAIFLRDGRFLNYKGEGVRYDEILKDTLPTYTVSELLYKLHEWLHLEKDGKKYSGGLSFCKDAPFYMWYYDLKKRDEEERESDVKMGEYLFAEAEYPIESLASLLIQCHQKGEGDTGNISDK